MAFTTNLVSYWKLDAASVTADAHASNALTNVNTVTTAAGKINEAASFVAASSQRLTVTVNSSLQLGDIDFTVQAWVYLASKGENRTICSEYAGAQSSFFLYYDSGTDRFSFDAVTAAGAVATVRATAFGSPALNTWYHVIAKHDSVANTITIKINNTTAASTSHSGGTGIATGSFRIGGNEGGVWFWDGRIDEVALWKRITTDAEDTTLYNSGSGFSYASFLTAGTTVIPVDDAAFVAGLSPYNWERSGSSYVRCVNSGAYTKFSFTGTQLKFVNDFTAAVTASISATRYPSLRVSIDGGAWADVTMTDTETTIALDLTDATHTALIYVDGVDGLSPRWNGTMAVKITGVKVDENKVLSAATLRTNRLIAFGDSITEGAYINGPLDFTAYAARCEATSTYLYAIAQQLNAEYGACAFGGQSWDSLYNSDIPALPSTWSSILSGVTRLSGGMFTPAPDYLLCNMGANGGVASASTVTTWLTNVRAAAGSSCRIIVIIPFAGTGRTNITAGVTAYLAANPSDLRTHLVDTGDTEGLTTSSGTGTFQGTDGLHPNHTGSLVLAAKVAGGIASAVVGTVPVAADVRYGTAVGATTGSLRVPSAGNVLSGVLVDAGTGTLALPSAANVRSATVYGVAGTGSTGTLVVPSVSNVLNGVSVDNTTGTYVTTAVGNVRAGTVFGAASALTGTLALPGISDVRGGIQFGASGTEYAGTLVYPPGGGSYAIGPSGGTGAGSAAATLDADNSGEFAAFSTDSLQATSDGTAGVSGVSVKAFLKSTAVDTATTGSDGRFSDLQLGSGDFYLVFDTPGDDWKPKVVTVRVP